MTSDESQKKPITLEDRANDGDRLFSPAAARNRDPVLQVLREVLPAKGGVLEIASGTGEHVAHFAKHLPGLRWQPTEFDETSRLSVRAWIAHETLSNVAAPIGIDASTTDWGVEDQRFDAILSMNMIHIAPWAAAVGLFMGAGRLLKPGGILFLYGAFKQGGVHNAPSNEEFDRSLKSHDPDWGVRDIDDLSALASANSLRFVRSVVMPANNQSLIFEKRP
jgi:cyclopropane fatty-acyl-phospholipid synthase-like methyltransferase